MGYIKLPMPYEGKNLTETVQILSDVVIKLRKELQFGLQNLDGENIPGLNKMVTDIDGNATLISQTSEQIVLMAQDVAGNSSSISVMSGQISLMAQDVAGNTSSISVLSGQIALKVSTSQYTASVIVDKINGGTVSINASKIDLTGITRIYDPASASRYIEFSGGNMSLFKTNATNSAIIFPGSCSVSNPAYTDALLLSAFGNIIIQSSNAYLDVSGVYGIIWGTNAPTAVFG